MIELNQRPQKITDLLNRFETQGNDRLLPSAIVREIEQMGIGGEGYKLNVWDLPNMLRGMKAKIHQLQTRLFELEREALASK